MRQRRLDQVEAAEGIVLHDLAEGRRRLLADEAHRDVGAGGVDRGMHAAEMLGRLIDEAADLGLLAQVDLPDMGLAAGAAHQRGRLVGPRAAHQVAQRHIAAAFGELDGDGAADAARAADHHRAAARREVGQPLGLRQAGTPRALRIELWKWTSDGSLRP